PGVVMVRLDKVYATLTDSQRFAVGISAVARGDLPEMERVLATAARRSYSLLSTTPAAVVLDAVGMRHLTERLELGLRLNAALVVSMSMHDAKQNDPPGGDPADTVETADRPHP